MNDFSHLSEEEKRVLRDKGTEMPFSGEFNKFYEDGAYYCKACGNLLFKSETKFDSGVVGRVFGKRRRKGVWSIMRIRRMGCGGRR